jgi:hypothetical protein
MRVNRVRNGGGSATTDGGVRTRYVAGQHPHLLGDDERPREQARSGAHANESERGLLSSASAVASFVRNENRKSISFP